MTIGQYVISRQEVGFTHTQAAALAASLGGTLAVVSTADEGVVVLDVLDLSRDLWSDGVDGYGPWIGLTQATGSAEPSGGWAWDNGEALTYELWQAGQPDNQNGARFAAFYDEGGMYWWDDLPDDPVGAGEGVVKTAMVELGAGRKAIAGSAGDDFVWGGAVANTIRAGDGADEIYAGRGNDTVYGGNGDDWVSGDVGADLIIGGAGSDELNGDDGHDTLVGGSGADLLNGSWGADTYVFSARSDAGVGIDKRDVIFSFSTAERDKIDLSGLDAIPGGADDAFTFVGGAAFTGLGQVRTAIVDGVQIVDINLVGDTRPDMRIELQGSDVPTLLDFLL